MDSIPVDFTALQGQSLSIRQKSNLILPITNVEIREAIFSMKLEKSPGPNGYSSGFFKSCWNIIESDFCAAIEEFFSSGKLLKEANSTFIALIPKLSPKHHPCW